ncbi:hypothetical protein PTKIN_Ptkin13bG0107200 [Pterospermum kingtungense]
MDPIDQYRQKGKAPAAATLLGNEHQGPCPVCKDFRLRCAPGCLFTAYPRDLLQHFPLLKQFYGLNNVENLLREVPEDDRESFLRNLVVDAVARDTFPGICFVDTINKLSLQVMYLSAELEELESLGGQSQPQQTIVPGYRIGYVRPVSWYDMLNSLERIQEQLTKKQGN